ncbi:MAG: dual specificity protein phosphatase family protein [Elusimicrobia bacterium]|nr:dual specificity protein phosphatase family protein [Elusimicrobiota bacterium]
MSPSAVLFPILGGIFAWLGYERGASGWFFVWMGVSGVGLGLAYGGIGPRLMGKRPDGGRAWWSYVVFGPHFLISWLVWRCLRFGREPACNEVSPGIWVGRRPYPAELPEVDLIVDLTSEFAAADGIGSRAGYLCVPMLDGTAGDPAAVQALISRLAAEKGRLYIHCAQGHGRSAMVAAGLLLARGLAKDAGEAEAILRRARPGVALNPEQKRRLASFG